MTHRLMRQPHRFAAANSTAANSTAANSTAANSTMVQSTLCLVRIAAKSASALVARSVI
jgi:hypothetical protein